MRGHELLKPALPWQYQYSAHLMPTADATNVAPASRINPVESPAESHLSENRARLRLDSGTDLACNREAPFGV